jgi:hypothetical protein
MPGVDARANYKTTDSTGKFRAGNGWLGLKEVGPNETKYTQYFFNFGFINNEGDEEKWQLAYSTPPGVDPDTYRHLYGLPVMVVGADTDDDGVADSWTITGTAAGLRRMKVGNQSNPVYYGQDVGRQRPHLQVRRLEPPRRGERRHVRRRQIRVRLRRRPRPSSTRDVFDCKA